jgi:hypothetical protein
MVYIFVHAIISSGRIKAVPELIDPDFAKTSLKRSFSMTENELFRLFFAKSGSINSGTGLFKGIEK